MPPDGVPRHRSLVFPILLIFLGALFLYAQLRPGFDPFPVLWTYWPVILILLGLGMIWDNTRRRQNPDAPQNFSVGSTIGALAFIFVLVAIFWHGHGFARGRKAAFATQHQFQTVERQDAKSVRASIEMGAGDLTVSGGSTHLLDASFDYRPSSGKPQVDYHVDAGAGQLSISQGDSETHINTTSDNSWNLRLAGDLPVDLKINMGAGEGHLRLRDLDLTNFELNIGAGRVDVDLTGNRTKDLHADIQGGVGEADIRLPKNIGVIVNASGGLGTIQAHGLKNDGDEYTNAAYGKAPVTIHLNVQGGIGLINLIQEP